MTEKEVMMYESYIYDVVRTPSGGLRVITYADAIKMGLIKIKR